MKTKIISFVKRNIILIILFFLSFLLEFWFSNNPSDLFPPDDGYEYDIDLTEFELENGTVRENDDEILFTENNATCFYIPDDPDLSLRNVYISFEGESSRVVNGEIRIMDNRQSKAYETVNTFQFNPSGLNEVTVSARSSDSLYTLQIFLSNGAGIRLNTVTLNYDAGIQFNWIRWFVMILCLAGIFVIKNYGLCRKYYDPDNKNHVALSVFMWWINVAIVLFITINMNGNFTTDIPYPLAESDSQYPLMVKLFDSFQKGHLNLEIVENEAMMEQLADLDNPYDFSLRNHTGTEASYHDYFWDHAYYNDHLYSYFGVTPILLFYYPHYWLYGTLPSDLKMGLYLSLMFVTFCTLLIHKVISCFKIHVDIFTVLLTILTIPAASLVFMMSQKPNVYYVAFLSAYVWIIAFLYLSIVAYQNRHTRYGIFCYAAAGVCLVLTVGSRPTTIIPAFLLILPLYFHVLTGKEIDIRQKIKLVAGFAVPVVIGASLIMWYNYARFESPFDFGTNYQLTVSDIKYNKITFSAARVWSYLYQYWIHPLKLNELFPFIDYNNSHSYSDGHYLWLGSPQFVTVFAVPINLLLLMIPWYIKGKPIFQKCIMFGGTIGSILILYINYCLGGVHLRYVFDGMLTLVLLSCLIAWELISYLHKKRMHHAKKIIYVMFSLSIMIGCLLMFKADGSLFSQCVPDTYLKICQFFKLA